MCRTAYAVSLCKGDEIISYFAPYIDDTGIHMPTYEDRLSDLCEAYRNIFGVDAELNTAVPDYQLLSVLVKALDDTSALVVQAYNSRNPQYAAGNALDLLLPMYGMTRAAGETDAEVRSRINRSLASRGAGSADAIVAAVLQLQYVKDAKLYINDTDSTDARGIPAHSLAMVVRNGYANSIAQAIYDKKAPGIGTWGSTTANAVDAQGNAVPVSFSRSSARYVYVNLFIQLFNGLSQDTVKNAIQPAILDFINTRRIGETLIIPQIYGIAYAAAPEIAKDFVILDIQVSEPGASSVVRDRITCSWNENVSCLANGGVSYQWY